MARVLIIEDDEIMAECIARAVNSDSMNEVSYVSNALSAMEEINEVLPDLIMLDVLLDGPDGFSFLNELVSYTDTAAIPVIIITSLDLTKVDLRHYGVQKILQKETMTPELIKKTVEEVLANAK